VFDILIRNATLSDGRGCAGRKTFFADAPNIIGETCLLGRVDEFDQA
jgi:hypothetical protein